MHAAKCRTKFVAFDNKNLAKITLATIILLQELVTWTWLNKKSIREVRFLSDASKQIWI